MKRRIALSLVLSILAQPLLNLGVASAQDRPVVFVHGLASGGGTWEDAADRLARDLQISPFRPSLPWFATYETQAADLQNQLGFLDGTTIAVGHSNGGLVARQWSRLHPLSGIITVGTPHQGAPLVQNLPYLYSKLSSLEAAIDHLWDRLHSGCCEPWEWLFGEVLNYAFHSSTMMAGATFSAISNILGGSSVVLDQMIPGSAFHMDIDGPLNIAHEFADVGPRVGIVSVASNFWWGGPLRAVSPQNGDALASYRDLTVAILDGLAITLSALADDEDGGSLSTIASALWNVSYLLTSMDYWWCEAVSTAPAVGRFGCYENDMVVPVWSQDYAPMGAAAIWIYGPAHTQETKQTTEWISSALQAFMGVARRPPSPPPSGPGGPVTMAPDSFLWPEQWAVSDDQRFGLTYSDNRVVLFTWDAQVLWQVSTDGRSYGHIHLQDGDLVVYDGDGVPIWSSGTGGHPGAYLSVQNDGNMVIYDTNGAALWATNTNWY